MNGLTNKTNQYKNSNYVLKILDFKSIQTNVNV